MDMAASLETGPTMLVARCRVAAVRLLGHTSADVPLFAKPPLQPQTALCAAQAWRPLQQPPGVHAGAALHLLPRRRLRGPRPRARRWQCSPS